MNNRTRVKKLLDKHPPATPLGRVLLDRYLNEFEHMLDRPDRFPGYESDLVQGLVVALANTELEELTVTSLNELVGFGGTARRRKTTGAAINRLRRLLQETGELPSQSDLRDEARIARWIAEAPAAGRAWLVRWNQANCRRLGTHARTYATRRLVALEWLLEEHATDSDDRLAHLLLERLVHPIVDCRCNPVSRAVSPDRCRSCHGTIETHGSRPSPGPDQQRRIVRLARSYLAIRRQPVSWTGDYGR